MTGDVSWFRVLEHHARRTPASPLCVCDGATTTYAEMCDRATRLATGFAERGIARGDVVGLLAYNGAEFLETIFAAAYLGAIVMPINWRLAVPEVRYILEHSAAKMLVCDEALARAGAEAMAGLPSAPVPVCITDETLDGWARLADLRSNAVPPRRAECEGDAVHRLMYTSGTTGRPKGVMITHANLAWKNFAHLVELGIGATDVGLACGPLYHVGALDLTTTTLVAAGGSAIVHRSFDAAAVVDEIERSGVTVIWLAPAMVNAIMRLPDVGGRNLTSVRLVIAGGEKMPIPFVERLQRTFPSAWFADAYGLTETVSGDTFLDRESTLSKLGSVGRPCPYLDLQIWDEEGAVQPAGVPGEIVLRGPKVFPGYWRDDEATARAFAGGWFHTGDVGVVDEDGYLYIVDRLKDMIVSGGENIASSEVERVLYEHPAVVEAAVVARPDERWGEVPVAHVVLRPEAAVDPAELTLHCRERLAGFKVPKEIHLLDALPRNPSGKVLKRALRDGG